MSVADILSPAMIEAINRPTGDAVCLPNAAYTDSAVFEAERKRLFAEGWVWVAAGAQLPHRGDVLPLTSAGLPILLVRDKDNQINAFHNVCRHRGVQLVAEPQKRRPMLVCRYHSWTYGLDGSLIRTPCFSGPDDHDSPGIDRARMGLERIRCETWNDLVFIDLSGKAPPLARHLAPLSARWAHYDMTRLRHGGSCRFDLAANWKLAIENFLESYHLPWAHPTLNKASKMEVHYSRPSPNTRRCCPISCSASTPTISSSSASIRWRPTAPLNPSISISSATPRPRPTLRRRASG